MTEFNTVAELKSDDENNTLADVGTNPIMPANHRMARVNMIDTLVGANGDTGIVDARITARLNAYTPPTPTPNPDPLPYITDFVISSIGRFVDAPFTLEGNLVFTFTIHNPNSVESMLSLSQDGVVLNSNISPTSTSVVVNVTRVVLNNGDSATFTLSGTATSNAGGQPFSYQYVVTGRTPMTQTGTDLEWRSGDSGNFTTISNQPDNTDIDFHPVIDAGDNIMTFRVVDTKRLTSIRFGIGSGLYAQNEVNDWTLSVSGGYATYTRSGYVPADYSVRIRIGDV